MFKSLQDAESIARNSLAVRVALVKGEQQFLQLSDEQKIALAELIVKLDDEEKCSRNELMLKFVELIKSTADKRLVQDVVTRFTHRPHVYQLFWPIVELFNMRREQLNDELEPLRNVTWRMSQARPPLLETRGGSYRVAGVIEFFHSEQREMRTEFGTFSGIAEVSILGAF